MFCFREKELAKVTIKKEDVELIVSNPPHLPDRASLTSVKQFIVF